MEARYSIALTLTEFECSPAEITEKLKISPTNQLTIGQPPRPGRPVSEGNLWTISIDAQPENGHVLRVLMDLVASKQETFAEVIEASSVLVSIRILYAVNRSVDDDFVRDGLYLSPEELGWLTHINATLEFDLSE